MFDFFKPKKRVVVRYDSEDLTKDERLQSALNEVAFLRGQIAKRDSEEAKNRSTDKEKEEEQLKINELNEQVKELSKKDLSPFSISSVINYIKDKRNKKKPIKFTTFDGSVELGEAEDFVIMPDGAFGVVSDGKVIWASKDISHVFYWVAGLNTFAKNRIIPLCVNSKGQFEPNLQTEEISELVRDSDGKFKINRFNKKPVYEMVSELHEEISDLNNELEFEEASIAEQQKELNELDREVKLHKSRADKAQNELSMALNKISEIEMANGQIVRQNFALAQMKEINEELILTFEKVVNKWSGKIEQKFNKDIREEEWEALKHILDWAKQNMPQTIYVQPEKEEKPSLTEGLRPVKP